MFAKFLIKNFQLHKKLVLSLAPGVTTIVGESDKGKSSVIRALAFLCLNDFHNSYITWGEAKTVLKAEVDGHTLMRKKGKGVNSYILNGEEYKAFHSSVPETIQKVLNITEENFQFQLDQPFWFSLTPGQVSKELNRVVKLEEIDRSLASIASQLRKTKIEKKVIRERYDKAKEEKRELAYVPKLAEDYQWLEALGQARDRTRLGVEHLNSLVTQAEELGQTARSLASLVQVGAKLVEQGKALEDQQARTTMLRNLLNKVNIYQKSIGQGVPDLSFLKEMLGGIEIMKRSRTALSCLVGEAEAQKKDIQREWKGLVELQGELQGKLKGRCPVCGGDWDGDRGDYNPVPGPDPVVHHEL